MFCQSLDNVSSGKVVQVVNVQQSTAYSTTSSTHSTILSLAITPTSTSNKLFIEAGHRYSWPDGSVNHGWMTSSLYRDSTNIGWPEYYYGDDNPQRYCHQYIGATHIETVPSATAVTYHWKAGSNYGITLTCKNTEMTITEYAP